MLTPSEFRNFLWREFEAAGLILDANRYQELREEVSRYGIIQLEWVKSLVGEDIWRESLTVLKRPYPEEDCARVLGFGYALTYFVVAPLNLSEAERQAVIHLGTLCNFIVATYDHLLDHGINQHVLLPRWMLRLAAKAESQSWLVLLELMRPPVSKLITHLVMIYFQRLGTLPYARKHIYIHAFIKRAILRMYDAEGKTLTQRRTLNERTLQMKAALPFVIMGLPAWLGTPEVCPELCRWHLRWLYRLGEFFGWIDDLVDFEEDTEACRPNWLVNTRAKLEGGDWMDADLARMIAYRGKWITAEWQQRVGNINNVSQIVRGAFSASLVSWFGGI